MAEDFFKQLREGVKRFDEALKRGAVTEGSRNRLAIADNFFKFIEDQDNLSLEGVDYFVNLYFHEIHFPIPLTPFITSVHVNKQIRYPYEQAVITCKLPANMYYTMFMDNTGFPTTGQYVLIKRPHQKQKHKLPDSVTAERVTEFFGVVTNVGTSMRVGADGHIEFADIEIQCSSWATPLMLGQYRTTAYNLPEDAIVNNPGIGEFIISGEDWENFMVSEIVSGVEVTDIKSSITKLIQSLGYMRLPPALSVDPHDLSGLLYKYFYDVGYGNKEMLESYLELAGFNQAEIDTLLEGGLDDIKAYNFNKRGRLPGENLTSHESKMRIGYTINVATAKEDLPEDSVYRNYLPSAKDRPKFANLQRLETPFFKGGSVYDLIRHTFSPDEAVIELMCVFIPDMRDDNFVPPDSSFSASLGGTPTILWRFKPLHPDVEINKEKLNKVAEFKNKYMKSPEKFQNLEYKSVAEKIGRFQYGTAPTSFIYNYGHYLPFSEVIKFDTNINEIARINATYVENPILDTDDLTFTGNLLSEPVIDVYDALHHGLKMYDMNYPFQDLLKGDSSAIAEYLYLASAQQQKYYTGEVTFKSKGTMFQPGTWLTLGPIPYDEVETLTESAADKEFSFDQAAFNAAAKAGDTLAQVDAKIKLSQEEKFINDNGNRSTALLEAELRKKSFICYVEEIHNTLQVDPSSGHVETMHKIRFSRGSWGGVSQVLPPTKIGKLGRL